MSNFDLDEQKALEGTQPVKGSHFQFKSEKEWRTSSIPLTNRFTLNMKTLAEDLSTIPFYKRQNLPQELFSEEEIKKMDQDAKELAKQRNLKLEKDGDAAFHNKLLLTEDASPEVAAPKNVKCNEKSTTENVKEKKPDDLEDWLDSVLDD